MEIDVSRLVNDVDPFDISGSIAERGANAARETWANAVAAAPGLLTDAERAKARKWAAEFGAWDDEHIAAWTSAEVDALVLQYAAGDLRELQDLCPGDGFGDIDWKEAQALAHKGTVSGSLYASGEALYISID